MRLFHAEGGCGQAPRFCQPLGATSRRGEEWERRIKVPVYPECGPGGGILPQGKGQRKERNVDTTRKKWRGRGGPEQKYRSREPEWERGGTTDAPLGERRILSPDLLTDSFLQGPREGQGDVGRQGAMLLSEGEEEPAVLEKIERRTQIPERGHDKGDVL